MDERLIAYLSAPYTGRQTIPQLMATQQASVAQLRRANRD
jgi:hypothetical protein